jgi:heat-inducible transcriptional repressor
MRELTMISASYASRSGKPIGSIGVIGPRRMDYEKLISLVSYIAGRISEFLRVH